MARSPLVYTHTTAPMTTASATVVAAKNKRDYLLIINDGTVVCYLKLGVTAVVNEGIRLSANGGSYEMSREVGNLFQGAINGLTASGTATLLITEGTSY